MARSLPEAVPQRQREAAVRRQLEAHHALFGAFAEAWEIVGGMEHLVQFAQDDPATFYRLLTKMTPGMSPTSSINGDINITVNPALSPTSLDIEGEYEDIIDMETIDPTADTDER